MSKLNCPSCGAPISAETNKCPYCDTSYFDLSAIDIDENKPFYLKIRMGKQTITQLVRILPDISIEYESNPVDIKNYKGDTLCSFVASNSMFTNLRFEAVVDPKENRLCTVQYEG